MDLTKRFGQRWPVLGVAILASRRKQTSSGETRAFLAFLSHSISATNCKD